MKNLMNKTRTAENPYATFQNGSFVSHVIFKDTWQFMEQSKFLRNNVSSTDLEVWCHKR